MGALQSVDKSVENTISHHFWPLIFLLKIIGYCPLTYDRVVRKVRKFDRDEKFKIGGVAINYIPDDEKDPKTSSTDITTTPTTTKWVVDLGEADQGGDEHEIEEQKWEYGIKYSKFFFWSFASAIFWVIVWSAMTLDSGLGVFEVNLYGNQWWRTFCNTFQKDIVQELENRSLYTEKEAHNITQSMNVAMRVSMTVLPLAPVLETIFGWTESGGFAKFMNNWHAFEQNISAIFFKTRSKTTNNQNNSMVKRGRNFLIVFYAFLPSLGMYVLFVNMAIVRKDDRTLTQLVFDIFIIFLMFLHCITGILLEDIKVILTYRTLADAFLNIKEELYQVLATQSTDDTKLTAGRVREWRSLTMCVRDQAVEAGNFQKIHQLAVIALFIVTTTNLFFNVLNGPWGARGYWQTSVLAIGYVSVSVGRLYMKINAAQQITRNESLIAKELANIQLMDDDNEVLLQMEIKFLHDMIANTPTTICFGDYVTLNKRLLLGIASQVVTYLIVLMQFARS